MECPQDSKEIKLKYSKFLEDKRVVVVGPSPHIIESNNGDLIDSYDIVVRVNRGYIISRENEKHLGLRTDILYDAMQPQKGGITTMPIDKFKNQLKWVCASYPGKKHFQHILDFQKKVKNKISFHIVDVSFWLDLKDIMRVPHGGTIAILDLLRYNIKELFVTGITFYKTTDKNGMYYYDGYHRKPKKRKPTKTSKHDPKKQFKYIRNIYKKDRRLKVDNILGKILGVK